MAIQVASFLIPKNGNLWYVLDDKYIKGGLHVVPTNEDRDIIEDVNRKQGMLVIVQADGKVWSLAEDMLTWNEFKVGGQGGVRQTVVRKVLGIANQDRADFEISLGGTALIYNVEVDQGAVQVEAFESAARAEDNPYRFISTTDHLVDNGLTKMTDGSILRGRRYFIFANNETPPSSLIYFRLTNLLAKPATGDVPGMDVTLKITFMPMEDALPADPSLNT